jgi:hypothetical protein
LRQDGKRAIRAASAAEVAADAEGNLIPKGAAPAAAEHRRENHGNDDDNDSGPTDDQSLHDVTSWSQTVMSLIQCRRHVITVPSRPFPSLVMPWHGIEY